MSKFNVGDKVRYIGKKHKDSPEFYPPVGTIGTVVQDVDGIDYYIQWPKGSTSGEDCWYCNKNNIELVENVDMTNEEIWEMLRPKMKKNRLSAYMFSIPTLENIEGDIKWGIEQTYKANDVHNAIALAYRSGYERAMKGRPFKFGEKKKKSGHWEPVDPNNLPKEGTKVRYARECIAYLFAKKPIIKINDSGVVCMYNGWFGMKADKPRNNYNWVSFDDKGEATCLDMWVEDDE